LGRRNNYPNCERGHERRAQAQRRTSASTSEATVSSHLSGATARDVLREKLRTGSSPD